MKKYLMTWYGTTDLRASIGLESTSGPVLGALLADEYTDVVILGFTNPDKNKLRGRNEEDIFQQKWADIEISEPTEVKQYFDIFSNTQNAHEHFIQWLQQQLLNVGKEVKLRFNQVVLKHLNDTEGIYDAAMQSINAVAMETGDKMITFYLSPGTPVMAFVWAFAALRHPNLKKRLIASSQPGKPPENVILPNEWMEWHGKQITPITSDSQQYDVIFHLFGEQRIPNLLGVLQFSCKKHIFVNSDQYPAEVMKQFIGESEYYEVKIDPYNPEMVRSTILDQIAKMPANISIGFNLTGGTKLMYAGALAACRKVNATPFYFNSSDNTVIYLNDFKHVETKPIPSVETFIKLNGDKLFVSKQGKCDDKHGIQTTNRKNLTNELWKARSKISKLYRGLSRYNDNFQQFELHHNEISVSLSREKLAKISIGSKHFEFKEWPDFAKYLSGGWFEEYTYIKLCSLVETGVIKDVRIGLEVSFKEDTLNNKELSLGEQLSSLMGDTYQELDVAFTDGNRLYIVECKAGNVNSQHVMKLQNTIRYFGGTEGVAILALCFYPDNKIVRKKINDSKNVQIVYGNHFLKQMETIIQSGVNQ